MRPTSWSAARRRLDDGYERSSLTVAVCLSRRCLPSKKLTLRARTYDAYRRNIDLHITPRIGRGAAPPLRPDHLERLYAELADRGRTDGTGGLNPKTIVEIHVILRRALDDASRRGLIVLNPARIAHAPKRRLPRWIGTRRSSSSNTATSSRRAPSASFLTEPPQVLVIQIISEQNRLMTRTADLGRPLADRDPGHVLRAGRPGRSRPLVVRRTASTTTR